MYAEDAFFGYPINFQDICLVYPPLNEDIVKVGFQTFMVYTGLLTRTKEDIEDELSDNGASVEDAPDPFTFLLVFSKLFPQSGEKLKEALQFFTHEKITILYEIQSIVIGAPKEKRLITQQNFFDFQNIIRAAIGEQMIEKIEEEENPKIRRFKALQRKRDRIKAKQNNGGAPTELLTILTSVCCMNMGLNPTNIGKVSFASVKYLMARYTEKDAYETKLAGQLAGSDCKENPYWIKDFQKQ